MSQERSSPDVSFRIGTNCFGGNRRFHSWCKVQRGVMRSIVFIFSIKNGSADACTCNKSSRCVCQGSSVASVDLLRRCRARAGWGGPGQAAVPRATAAAGLGAAHRAGREGSPRPGQELCRKGNPFGATGGNEVAHLQVLTSAREPLPQTPAARAGHAPSTTGTLRAKWAAVDEIPGGLRPPGGNTWLLFLAIHHAQPKMKEETIPVPGTDGGRAPNDAVNVPSEEVSPNPQQICPVSP